MTRRRGRRGEGQEVKEEGGKEDTEEEGGEERIRKTRTGCESAPITSTN